MAPETLDRLEQIGRAVAIYSPLLLFAFKWFRGWVMDAAATLAEPITSRIRANADALTAIRATLENVERTIQTDCGAIRAQVSVVTGMVRLQQDTAAEVGYFESDADGRNVWVSATYTRWMGATAADLLGWGFVTYTHPDDRQRVQREWERCRTQHTDYRERMRMGPIGGPYAEYDILIRPIPDAPPAVAWAGSIRPAVNHGRRRSDRHEAVNGPRTDTGD